MDEMEAIVRRLRKAHIENASKPVAYECSRCRDTGFISRTDEMGREIVRRCECFALRRARELAQNSGISEEFGKKTFENFDAGENPQLIVAKTKALEFARNFERVEHDRRNSILICGQVGSGKTHLGTAICGDLMNRGVAVLYMPYRNAITRLKQNIIDEAVYNRELGRYASARVLYIDDLLKGKLTESDANIMYEIVNYRYMNNMPFVISTEKTINDLLAFDEAIGSRLIEMCRSNIIHLQGKDLNYRLR